ncbi:MAG: HDOD domain-containing protein [Spirochaetes bacterium]|nr:HDOD domain-containing protein [Spirochaetota bacterium]
MINQTSQLSSKLEAGEAIKLTFYNHNRNVTRFINSLFSKILSKNDLQFLQSTIETIIREMIVNAVKANSKRVYFKRQNLIIEDKDHYVIGMKTFKDFIISNREIIDKELKENGYHVDILIKKENSGIKIRVQNNAPILPDELERVKKRINEAKKYNNFAEACMDISDDSEGEGFGILLTILFLRNAGIGEDHFKVQSNKILTQSEFFIPYRLSPVELSSGIKDEILNEVEELPSFPEYITELQNLCNNPDISIKLLAEKIQIDPALSVSVLKLSNSAGFITGKRIEELDDAIKVIGISNLKAILLASSARKIFEDRYRTFREIWEHCNKVAFYARSIAIKYKMHSISDRIFLAGILHDIGKIILLSISPELSNKISDLSLTREMRTSTVIEEVSIGVSHSQIGKLIAEKWNFPDYLIASIEHHHNPLVVEEAYKPLVFCIYLANKICNIESGRFFFEYCENEVLDYFKINDAALFERTSACLKTLFEKQNSSI